MRITRTIRVGIAGAIAALLACQPFSPEPAAATTVQSKTITGDAFDEQDKIWFQREFDTGERFFGSFRGNFRFLTETRATLSTTRSVASTDLGAVDAGAPLPVTLSNTDAGSRLRVTARPTLQFIFEWQPPGDPYECDNSTFPTFTGDEWFRRRNVGPILQGVCGAIEITADDISKIADILRIDLEIPQVFTLMDRAFTSVYGGTQTITDTKPLFDVPVCQIASRTFELGIGDRCDIQLHASATVPLTTLGHTLNAQLCTDARFSGDSFACVGDLGSQRPITFTGPDSTFVSTAPCVDRTTDVDVRLTDAEWRARVEDVTVSASAEFNIHATADGEGRDLFSFDLPGSISLLNGPMPLTVDLGGSGASFPLHVAELAPDDDAPTVTLLPSAVTIDEGSSTTFAPRMSDRCTAAADLVTAWQIDGRSTSGPTLTRSYDNDLPDPLHSGSLAVSDAAGNRTTVPFSVRVRNVPPSVQLAGLPSAPVPLGTTLDLRSQVTDPGADKQSWNWSFGDGTTEGRTAASVTDRTDNRTHTYAKEGLYTLQLGVRDGTDLRSAGGVVTVFDPRDRLVGSGVFTSDRSSIAVPVGSTYTVQANVAYPSRTVRPAGSFTADFLLDIGGNETVSKHLVGTSYEWVFEDELSSAVQGLATLDGETGWKFHAELIRSEAGARASRITVAVWRPGVTTLANPDYRFGGPRDTGNLS